METEAALDCNQWTRLVSVSRKKFSSLSVFGVFHREEPQHTDLSTVIECYAISSGEEPQHTDFQLWCSRHSQCSRSPCLH